MKKYLIYLLVSVASLSACAPQPESPKGFRLPDGNAENGRQAYLTLRCNNCHQVQNSTLPFSGSDAPVVLGGETTRVRTYGELVTSMINPSHKIAANYPQDQLPISGESPMVYAGLNEVMTIQQVVDLVAFLQPSYQVVAPPDDPYSYPYNAP